MTILRSEFYIALSELKSNKAPGIDYIPAQSLQNSNQIVKDALISLESRDIYEKGKIPYDYCKSIIVTISKKQKGVEQQHLKILHFLYKHQTAEIKKGETTVNAKIKKGTRQGCTQSPPLFNRYIEK